jgi:hypothetical protein
MNLDMGTIVLIGIIVVAVYLLYKRLMPQQSPYSQQGSNRPQYDDPNISSHGGFGGNQQQQGMGHRQYDDPNIESHGGFGTNGGSNGRSNLDQLRQGQTKQPFEEPRRTVSEKMPESPRGNDDPNIKSHGGFGG